jgi:hypothetical protein
MYDDSTEAFRFGRPLALSIAAVLDALSCSADRAARSLREGPVRNGSSLAGERPRDRLGPRDRLLVRHFVTDGWRVK